MFDGVPHEQLHQFIGSSRATSNPLPLVNPLPLSSFHLHHNHIVTSTNSPTIASNSFDSYSHHQLLLNPLQQQQQQQFIHPLLHHKRINVNNNNNTTIGDKQEQQQQEVNNNNSRNSTEGLVSDVDLDQIERETPTIMEEPMNSVNAVDEPWSNEEVLVLLRIRSTMESWFPDFTWEHVSRKLAEHGFKMRSGEKCKEKYEEENRYFNNINNCTKNLRPYFLSDLEELYNTHTTSQQNPSHNHHQDNNNNSATNVMGTQKAQTTTPVVLEKSFDHIHNHDHIHGEIFGAKECSDNHNQKLEELEDHKALETTNNNMKKRKRSTATSDSTKFEMFKGFCEDIVNKLMAQQEEMHNKLLEDMVKRDQEKLKKEEAWKKSEMDRMNKELEIMAREQAVAGDRQAAIIDFLRKFSSNPNPSDHHHHQEKNSTDDHHQGKNTKNNIITGTNSPSTSSSLTTPSSSSSLAPLQSHPNDHQNPNNNVSLSSSSTFDQRNPSSSDQKKPQNQNPSPSPAPGTNDVVHEDLGKRWPRDEVLALINLRCSLYENNNNGDQQNIQSPAAEQSAAAKSVPLWERISQGMGEMGYKRSAKRCKEKWENINKYFRKTKDVNKKRSVDSRTCPYFHQLSTLYNKGTLHDQNNHQDMMMIHDHHLDLDLDHDNQR